jgi:hypothetical protein
MVKESIYDLRLRSNIITVINSEVYGGIFSGSHMKYPYCKEKILQAQLFSTSNMAAVVREWRCTNVDFCLNVHISDLTYIWKLLVYTLGTCLKKPSWFLDMRIRIYFFNDFLAVGPWSTSIETTMEKTLKSSIAWMRKLWQNLMNLMSKFEPNSSWQTGNLMT